MHDLLESNKTKLKVKKKKKKSFFRKKKTCPAQITLSFDKANICKEGKKPFQKHGKFHFCGLCILDVNHNKYIFLNCAKKQAQYERFLFKNWKHEYTLHKVVKLWKNIQIPQSKQWGFLMFTVKNSQLLWLYWFKPDIAPMSLIPICNHRYFQWKKMKALYIRICTTFKGNLKILIFLVEH